MRIYIAGPYVPKNCSLHDASRISKQNVDNAINIFHLLKEQGHTPFVPHLSHYLHINGTSDYGEWWYSYDLTFLVYWAEGMVLTGNWKESKGCLLELKIGNDLRIPVYIMENNKLRLLTNED